MVALLLTKKKLIQVEQLFENEFVNDIYFFLDEFQYNQMFLV